MSESNIFWDCDKTACKEFMEEFKEISGYTDFNFKYNWRINFPEIEDYLSRLLYSSYSRNKDQNRDLIKKLPELIHYMEDFFAQSIKDGLITKVNISNILGRLKNDQSGLRAIMPLPEKGLFGKSIRDTIEINLNMERHGNSPFLSEDDLIRLYLYHEVGHKILNIHSNEVAIDNYLDTVDAILQEKGIVEPDTFMKEVIPDGLLMIEECLTQELAERLTYEILGKKRPTIKPRNEIANIQGGVPEICQVPTNHDFYGIFQQPTIEFGKTLRGCHNRISTNEDVLLNMISKALYTNFDEDLFREYYKGDGSLYQDLFRTLRAMGLLLDQKYASFGQGKPIKGVTSESCITAISRMAAKNEDMRPYPQGGFSKIEYGKYRVTGLQPIL